MFSYLPITAKRTMLLNPKFKFNLKAAGLKVRALLLGLFAVMTLTLQGCSATVLGGLNGYTDSLDGYKFLYPTGWTQVKNLSENSGLDVLFHDIIEQTENISVVINPTPGKRSLTELGTPSEVGYRLGKSAIAPEGSGREAELVNAEAGQVGDRVYYLLEYAVKLSNGLERHNISSAVVYRGNLYTLNASTPEARWEKMKGILEQSVKSFTVDG
jgi:photosystem II oxygen-evolving enhancer protein 2